MTVFVISKNGERLMPTTRLGKVRHMLKDGKAVIYSRKPFAIQLTYETTAYTQPLELCVDAGYQHVGISLKSERREYLSEQRDLLSDEKARHDDCRRYRRTRRNRKRYRAPRFNNRRIPQGWLAPSLKHKADAHIALIERICAAAPVIRIVVEVGQFDTQVLAAVQEGKPIPEGVDYQHGERYGIATLREAAFFRDKYTCQVCGRTLKDGAILHVHHAFFWKGMHGNKLIELLTVCERCHTSANHQPGGKLYGYDKKIPDLRGAAFMNVVKWYIYEKVQGLASEVKLTYGAATKLAGSDMGLEKSHINDAFAMGKFHPTNRAEPEYYRKRRRNNRCLERFYDAKYIDLRDGTKKSGAQLGCQRTNRREPRVSPKNLRMYHGVKMSKGRRSIRRRRYAIQPGDTLVWNGGKHATTGCHCNGTRVMVSGKSVAIRDVTVVCHAGGWLKVS